ncbi:hypothetical protein [Kaarinaea lacus]
MSNEDKALMEQFGITTESKTIYRYKEHRYENLKDALNFAKKETSQNMENGLPKATE